MVDLNGHEAGNGGYSHRKPTAHRDSSTRKVAITPGYEQASVYAVEASGEEKSHPRHSPYGYQADNG